MKKTIIPKMKNFFDWHISSLNTAEENISEFEVRSKEILKVKHKEEKEIQN